MATSFKQVADNAVSTTTTSYAATGVTSTVLATGTGTRFPTPGNGFVLTIWDRATYPDPMSDPNMEQVTVTARSTDTLTHSATTKTHAAATNTAALLNVASNLTDLQTAVNTLEASSGGTTFVGSSSYRSTDVNGLTSYSTIPFNTAEYGTDINSSGVFTAPSDGYYRAFAQVSLSTGTVLALAFKKNGTNATFGGGTGGSIGYGYYNARIEKIFYLTAGNTLTVIGEGSGGAAYNLSGSNLTSFFQVTKLG